MRLHCHVLVQHNVNQNHRNACSLKTVKPTQGFVTIGADKATSSSSKENGEHKNDVVLLVTTMKQKNHDKFMVSSISKVFDKFVSSGRLTIQFKEPPAMLLISQADSAQLSVFCKLLRACLAGNAPAKLNVAIPESEKLKKTLQTQNAKTKKQIIKSKSEYPFMAGFSREIAHLEISDCLLTRVDPRWFKLSQLTILRLENNDFSRSPVLNFTCLPNLTEVSLSKNNLTSSQFPILPSNIRDVDLSYNNDLRVIPPNFFRSCRNLRNVDFRRCFIERMPETIQLCAATLKVLLFDGNCVASYPSGLSRLRLTRTDLNSNHRGLPKSETGLMPLVDPDPSRAVTAPGTSVCTLKMLAIDTVLHYSLPTHQLPVDIRAELTCTNWVYCCECNKPCIAYGSYGDVMDRDFVCLEAYPPQLISTRDISTTIELPSMSDGSKPVGLIWLHRVLCQFCVRRLKPVMRGLTADVNFKKYIDQLWTTNFEVNWFYIKT